MVGELGHHHVSQQAGGGDALVDHLGRHRRLDQRFAMAADPFPTHVLFDGEHAWCVVELFADIFAHALQLAAAGALGVFGLVADHGAWELHWQRRTLGLLAWLRRDGRRVHRLQLGLNGGDVGVDQIVEQAALGWAQLLAALGELVTLEQSDLVGQLFVDRFDVLDLLAQRIDLRQQLRGQRAQLVRGHLVEVGRGSHAGDCARAGKPRRRIDGLMAGATAL
ncbi:hypothetical protein D3C85_1009450 [compost metagenome]